MKPFVPFKAPRVLFKTKNSSDEYIGNPVFREDFCYLSGSAARLIAQQNVVMAGIDYLSIEKYKSPAHDVHKTLLGSGVVIIEGLDLRNVPAGVYELICLPLNLPDANGAPARVMLLE